MTKSRGILNVRRWTFSELEQLRATYPNQSTATIAKALDRPVDQVYAAAKRYGLAKSADYLADPANSGRLDGVRGATTRFQKGAISHNKGKTGMPSASPATTFKPGTMPHNWLPVGTLNTTTEGYLKVKLREPRDWAFLHELVWASMHGWPRPPGTLIAFVDGNRLNCDPTNLVLRTREEHMALHTIHRYPPELKSLIRVKASLTRKINDHEQDRRRTKRVVCADGATGEGGQPGERDRTVEGDG